MIIIDNKFRTCLLFLALLTSCSNKKNNCLIINKEFISEWKIDSIGCLKYRYKLIEKNNINTTNFKNADFECIKSELGSPNITTIERNYITYYYYVTCKYAPINKFKHNSPKLTLNTEVSFLVLKVDRNNIIFDANFIVP